MSILPGVAELALAQAPALFARANPSILATHTQLSPSFLGLSTGGHLGCVSMAQLASSFSHRSQNVDLDARANVPHRQGLDSHRADRHNSYPSRCTRLSLTSDMFQQASGRIEGTQIVETQCINAVALRQDLFL